jgi:translation initiation factor 2 alpha subunit (eIF-2alpha)
MESEAGTGGKAVATCLLVNENRNQIDLSLNTVLNPCNDSVKLLDMHYHIPDLSHPR